MINMEYIKNTMPHLHSMLTEWTVKGLILNIKEELFRELSSEEKEELREQCEESRKKRWLLEQECLAELREERKPLQPMDFLDWLF